MDLTKLLYLHMKIKPADLAGKGCVDLSGGEITNLMFGSVYRKERLVAAIFAMAVTSLEVGKDKRIKF